MNEVFINNEGDSAIFSDEGITFDYTFGNDKVHRFFPYGSIETVGSPSNLFGISLKIVGKDIAPNGKNFRLEIPFNKSDKTRIKNAVSFAIEKMKVAPRETLVERVEVKPTYVSNGSSSLITYNTPTSVSQKTSNKKDASVVGRAVVGGIIAGPAGAIVGAISAADKNHKNKK